MEFRVIERNGWFYPQYKWLFIWWSFKSIKLGKHGNYKNIAHSSITLQRALDEIERRKNIKVKIHLVKEYNVR